MRLLVFGFVVPLVVAVPGLGWDAPIHAAAEELVGYRPPVDGPIVDRFRPPFERWGPGNRGVDYRVAPGTPVAASAPGEVVFAGPVGGDLHVVVLHADGLRSSYSFLASIVVRRGQLVAAGERLGTAGELVHFGVRDGDRYLDPLAVMEGRRSIQLLPDREAGPAAEAVEGAALAAALRQPPRQLPGQLLSAGGTGVPEAWRGWLHYGVELTTPVSVRAAAAVADWRALRRRCTPDDVEPPARRARRLAVLVAGLGSTSRTSAVRAVETSALGYAPGDIVLFSYRGGTAADKPYRASDTTDDLRLTGSRLHALVSALAASHPGVPVDVVAHSQGGLVARIAVLEGAPADLTVTLGSPHGGADLATAAAMVAAVSSGDVAFGSTSVLQMAETSSLMRELAERPLPSGISFVSIAARGDLVVPPLRSRVRDAANVTVTLPPPYATVHRRLPGSPEATREISLALAGLPPTCQSLADVVTDHLVSTTTSLAEDSLGASLALLTWAR